MSKSNLEEMENEIFNKDQDPTISMDECDYDESIESEYLEFSQNFIQEYTAFESTNYILKNKLVSEESLFVSTRNLFRRFFNAVASVRNNYGKLRSILGKVWVKIIFDFKNKYEKPFLQFDLSWNKDEVNGIIKDIINKDDKKWKVMGKQSFSRLRTDLYKIDTGVEKLMKNASKKFKDKSITKDEISELKKEAEVLLEDIKNFSNNLNEKVYSSNSSDIYYNCIKNPDFQFVYNIVNKFFTNLTVNNEAGLKDLEKVLEKSANVANIKESGPTINSMASVIYKFQAVVKDSADYMTNDIKTKMQFYKLIFNKVVKSKLKRTKKNKK